MNDALESVVIVGGGPAGMRAAEAFVAHGVRPLLIDEAARPGGQGYRTPPASIGLDMPRLLGRQHARHARLHAEFAALHAQIDHHPETLVFAIEPGRLHVVENGRARVVAYRTLIIASGATDRVMPVPGWTLPGVFSLGGAQLALKDQGCLIGPRVVFVGSSPLLALAAAQYRRMGAEVVAVCDETPFAAKARAAPALARAPGTFAFGVSLLAELKRAGVVLRFGVAPLRIEGERRVEAIMLRDAHGRETRLACDAVALGHGLKPETQLADLAGASFAFDAITRLWTPVIDADGRAGSGLYLAGDGAAIGGAEAAQASGALAALAALKDAGTAVDERRMERLRANVARLRAFQRGIARAFVWPAARAATLPDDTVLCRCENVSVGEVRTAVASGQIPPEVNRVKAITRCGMGRCQGRFCGPALQEVVAAQAAVSVAEVGRLRGQAPVKPIALNVAGHEP